MNPDYQVVVHIDERHKGTLGLNNIENLIADLGKDKVNVELVANYEGIEILLKSPETYLEQIERLEKMGVKFAACSNTMRQRGITKEELVEFAQIVPSGVGELVKKQSQGWAYIRP
ncbi:MAG: DsrE family protein [Desulfosporosinus sp.]|nr:DsrE family protein [Desulfosporosinus sp.]